MIRCTNAKCLSRSDDPLKREAPRFEAKDVSITVDEYFNIVACDECQSEDAGLFSCTLCKQPAEEVE